MKLYTEEQVKAIADHAIKYGYWQVPENVIELSTKDSLKDKLFSLANEFAVAGYGKTAVLLHTIHNGFDVNEQESNNRK